MTRTVLLGAALAASLACSACVETTTANPPSLSALGTGPNTSAAS
jgi:hypothetical protein